MDDSSDEELEFKKGQQVWCLFRNYYYKAKVQYISNYIDGHQYYGIHYIKFSRRFDEPVNSIRLLAINRENDKYVKKHHQVAKAATKKYLLEQRLKASIIKQNKELTLFNQPPFLKIERLSDEQIALFVPDYKKVPVDVDIEKNTSPVEAEKNYEPSSSNAVPNIELSTSSKSPELESKLKFVQNKDQNISNGHLPNYCVSTEKAVVEFLDSIMVINRQNINESTKEDDGLNTENKSDQNNVNEVEVDKEDRILTPCIPDDGLNTENESDQNNVNEVELDKEDCILTTCIPDSKEKNQSAMNNFEKVTVSNEEEELELDNPVRLINSSHGPVNAETNDLKLLCLVATNDLEDEFTTSDEQLVLDNQQNINNSKEVSLFDKSCYSVHETTVNSFKGESIHKSNLSNTKHAINVDINLAYEEEIAKKLNDKSRMDDQANISSNEDLVCDKSKLERDESNSVKRKSSITSATKMNKKRRINKICVKKINENYKSVKKATSTSTNTSNDKMEVDDPCNETADEYDTLMTDALSNNETRIKDQSNESYSYQKACAPPSFTEAKHKIKINYSEDETTADVHYVENKKNTKEKLSDEDHSIFQLFGYDKSYSRAAKVKANEAIAQMHKPTSSKEKKNENVKRIKNGKKKDDDDLSDEPKLLSDYLNIPDYVQQIIIEDKHLVEDDRLVPRVPAKLSVQSIFRDYASKFPVCEETLDNMCYAFDQCLSVWLLHPFEKQTYRDMLVKYPNRFMSQIYGLPHLIRFLIKLPKLFHIMKNNCTDFEPKALHFVHGLFIYLDDEKLPYGIGDYDSVLPDQYRRAYYS